MKLFGILGYPLAHTRSPAMHQAAFDALGLDATYVPFEVKAKDLKVAWEEFDYLGVQGFNVTLPHKESVLVLLDEVDETARAIGAVNTVWREGDKWIGTNTDAAGLLMSLVDAHIDISGARVVVLGAGGAARAAVVGLTHGGAADVVVAARREEQARALVDGVGLGRATSFADLSTHFASCTLLVQATSATLDKHGEAQGFADALPLDALPEGSAVVDLVYEPEWTTVRSAAAARGLTTVSGLGMLLHQGAIAFERFTGKAAPLEVMEAALRA